MIESEVFSSFNVKKTHMQVSKKTQQTLIKKEKTKQFSLIQIFYIFVSVVCIFCEALLSSGLHEASSTVAIEMFFICYHCVIWSTEKKKNRILWYSF